MKSTLKVFYPKISPDRYYQKFCRKEVIFIRLNIWFLKPIVYRQLNEVTLFQVTYSQLSQFLILVGLYVVCAVVEKLTFDQKLTQFSLARIAAAVFIPLTLVYSTVHLYEKLSQLCELLSNFSVPSLTRIRITFTVFKHVIA